MFIKFLIFDLSILPQNNLLKCMVIRSYPLDFNCLGSSWSMVIWAIIRTWSVICHPPLAHHLSSHLPLVYQFLRWITGFVLVRGLQLWSCLAHTTHSTSIHPTDWSTIGFNHTKTIPYSIPYHSCSSDHTICYATDLLWLEYSLLSFRTC